MSNDYLRTEYDEQVFLFAWTEWASLDTPELRLLYAIPNGGHRHPATAAKMKATGVKAGIPDTCLPVARGGFNSMYLELKREHGGKIQPNQRAWMKALQEQGHYCVVCEGAEAAKAELLAYLNGERVRT